ncbi:MAG: hypothetical protein JJE12_13120 [Anaerolineales bacterium]|nr:hypothetical protein [Anaerolineales bacterium]
MKIIIALFLIAHGLVHAGLAAAPNPSDPDAKPGAFFTSPDRSWLFHQLGLDASVVQWIGITLVVLSTLGFVLAGLGVFGVPGLDEIWRTIAVVSTIISLVLLVLFWHPWIIVGVLIDIGVLVSLLWTNWPSVDLIGS